jgi:serine phosphatase RsbU (regulator of sigma subunit)/anti-sigma regulatory factor (Ser/Thr protein kinase)/anti-anti-sigma regulatory factor
VTGAAQDDALARLVGDAVAVRDAFEQLPMILMVLTGPDHRLVSTNAPYRALSGRSDLIGAPYAEAFPGIEGRRLGEMLDRVYATGQPETGQEWRAPAGLAGGGHGGYGGHGGSRSGGSGGERDEFETYADFRVLPRRDAAGTVTGLLIMATDVTDRVTERREWRDALLPTALPVLPRARIAARYLVAGREQAAGGDWFDAIPLADGRIALAVGDVVGHGAAASAGIGQLRAVLAELLAAEPSLDRVLARVDAFAARTPALRAATLALVVLDPADGTMCYTTCGHPPPLVIGADGTTRFLAATGHGPLGTEPSGTGPLGTESPESEPPGSEPPGSEQGVAGLPPRLTAELLAPGELVLLYSDGLIERPDRSIPQGMADLAAVAAEALADQKLTDGLGADLGAEPDGTPGGAAERVCQLTVELLARTGYADDVTTLAAQRLADPVPGLRLTLPGERASVTVARDAFTTWLSRLDATGEDREALHLALVEVVTNAIEHAYPKDEPGLVEIEATLGDDGNVECRVTDHGTWRRPDPADADRGHGLMVAGHVVDTMLVSHLPAPAGTVVALRHRLRRPAILASGPPAGTGTSTKPGDPAFTAATSIQADGTARATVSGPVDINTADQLARRLLSVCRGGTIPLIADLTGVTQLASAGVRALYQVKERLAAHAHDLTLITKPGSSAHVVLDLVHLSHRSWHGPARGGSGLGGPGRGGSGRGGPALGGATS